MARSKAKKSGFIPWPWVGTDGPAQNDEAKLPPLEAFSYKGFMADLQNTTDIRSDLDRIAEICARSRYCLSDRYDSHVTPHGSGANFAASVRQHPNWSKGRRKGSSSPGGPTLQAVPSDDDESSARGMRRRRGGIGGPRRRSVAYGTLETIMSSSRSSEEDKTKKKSAADIKEAVRGRAARKDAQAIFDSSTVPALLSDPALPQTSDATIDFYSAVDIMNTQVPPVANNRHSRRRSQHVEPGVQIYDPDDEALHDPSLYLDPDDAVAASAGIFSGLTHWVPWRAANAYDMTAEQPMNSAHGRSQSHGTPMPSATGPPAVAGPSHAEGSLRELLKTVDDTNNRQKKGKAVDNNSGRR
ncbi:hypothetical protein SBRCBS47491_007116 [Sporothrix bragantina]|uniref:Uncharacterized protein n=1 Tax=Sporothrix bragantina TaxID=671064 RepID=A0ABP0CAI8_9PEZI